MTADDPSADVEFLTRIASIESKIRKISDLVPISSWGFSADVQEKLRQRKHRIVNQQLTAKEKKMLPNSRKQQVARTVGGVCRHVTEVIDLLGASAKGVQPKKASFPVKEDNPKGNSNNDNKKENIEKLENSRQLDQSLDVLEQREMAIRKLQEKLKVMKANRQSKKKASVDSSVAQKFEQERKLKRRVSKMKMKQRRSEEKRQKENGNAENKTEVKKAKEEIVSFSKFDFLVKAEGKKKRLSTSEKKQKFTGKDYKSLLNKVEKREEKLEKLREKEPKLAIEMEDDIRWNRAVKKAQGVKDNAEMLKKGLKRKEKMKEKRKEQWADREKKVEREKAKRQEKRMENLQKRIDLKKKNKLKVMRKKGRIL
ncbi:unnamed protein product [Strongylus vulgaris]|uniref:Ribosomal RNA-processing protein 14/surfeit locus protein 6 C-terminal domain-containing protein n=1 Tax=Strongylus vulgaris TaxID=40348 RepID=A0A3P7IWA7_STRVU|nr:unnamed protein product [Strongylus vulgaris]